MMYPRNIILYITISMITAIQVVASLKNPSYVSSWHYLEANSYSVVTITHNLSSLPAKVEVQVKATDGPNQDFIFPGTSSTQNDNDVQGLRGGVIYIYNEKEVILFSGVEANARIIHTGSSDNRKGPNVQSSMSGLVRAKVWSAYDLPKPDFSSSWFDIATHYASNPPFKEINHNLCVHPDFVSVQVQILQGFYAGYYFDGTGTCMVDSTFPYLNTAGVLYAYDEIKVRLWMSTTTHGYLFGLVAWGPFIDNHFGSFITNTDKGKARILAWRSVGKKVMESLTPYGDGVASEDYEIAIKREDISKDVFVSVEVQARDGQNKNFRFSGTGAAMEDPNMVGQYGGVVYSFNETFVRIWRPNEINRKGFISFVGVNWGGFYPQASNTACVVFKVWELQEQDEGLCTSGACLLKMMNNRCSCCAPSPEMCCGKC